jgi:UMF1 family MFS transporter
VGEFYGFYSMVGRFSAVIGPTMWAIVAKLTIGRGWRRSAARRRDPDSAGMVIFSWWVLRGVDDKPRDWAALHSDR